MNPKISLFVLAAGMGSRYGGLKQMEGFGPNGETIIDYSIYDAVKTGFDKIVFVIRPEMEEAFKEVFLDKYEGKVDVQYVFQSLEMVPGWYKVDPKRVKPWGTVQATLVAKEKLTEPFLIINGDDFYGRDAFEISAKFLRNECSKDLYCLPAYKIENVLNDNGTVKRGVCKVKDGFLTSIEETYEVKRNSDGTMSGLSKDGDKVILKEGDLISMNKFGVHNTIFDHFEKEFNEFLKENDDPIEGEFLLSDFFGLMVKDGGVGMKVLNTSGEWFGVTYREDGPVVREKLAKLVKEGVYPERLEL